MANNFSCVARSCVYTALIHAAKSTDVSKFKQCPLRHPGGGQGTRLFPLTRDRSKPAVPLAGKYRLVDIPISNCINSGLKRIYLLTHVQFGFAAPPYFAVLQV